MKLARGGFSGWTLGLLITVAVLSGCSTARPIENHRQGFLERMENPGSTRAPKIKKEMTGPGLKEGSSLAMGQSWTWPLEESQVTSRFGKRGNDFHEGVDLKAGIGTPVYAVDSGQVLYAGRRIRGYGNMIVLKHTGGLSTVYAHNSKLKVIKGQKVKKGQLIAFSGNTGRVNGPHLHFEVRSGVTAVDPLLHLPLGESRAPAAVSGKSKRAPGKLVVQQP